ncbi:MAG TPA: transposase, partial [Flexistipes sinusarabici]|nr:transposase [Flexistipes sinusarabici]
AQRVIDKFVEEYNNRRYHAAIGYLKPVDVFMGIGEEVIAERKAKLKKAREKRIAVNKEKRREFAGVC